MGKGGDGDDDDGGDGDGGGYNNAQVVRGVPEEQRLRGDRRDGAKPVGLYFQVRKLHCPGEIIIKIVLINVSRIRKLISNSNKMVFPKVGGKCSNIIMDQCKKVMPLSIVIYEQSI